MITHVSFLPSDRLLLLPPSIDEHVLAAGDVDLLSVMRFVKWDLLKFSKVLVIVSFGFMLFLPPANDMVEDAGDVMGVLSEEA